MGFSRGGRYGGIAHTWAAQVKPRGKNGNIFFEGPTIYSYGHHFPMATFVDPKTVFLTTRTYSSSTSAHLAAVRSALDGLDVKVFHVCHPTGLAQHSENCIEMRHEIETAMLKSARARLNKQWYLDRAQRIHEQLIEYVARFNPGFVIPVLDETLVERLKAEARIEAIRNAKENAEREKRRLEQERINALEAQEWLRQWLAGETNELSRWYGGDTHLRIRDKKIETSRGASVPLDVAPNLWEAILTVRSSGTDYVPMGDTQRIGDFALRQITKDGDLIVGCHTIMYTELKRIAEQIGLYSGPQERLAV